jgi:hypothetical protein
VPAKKDPKEDEKKWTLVAEKTTQLVSQRAMITDLIYTVRTRPHTTVKNPTGANEVVHALLAGETPRTAVIALNDEIADGRDVSWIWDAPIAQLIGGRDVVLTGSRAVDLRLRLKYDWGTSAMPPASLVERESLADALDLAISCAPRDGVVVIAATYTALMGLRSIAHQQGHASAAPR